MRNIYCVALFLFALLLLSPSGASAQTSIPPQDLNGYAWSNNIGWISLNCEQGGATGNNICGTSNYKVRINSDGSVTGYAWSNNIGWIRFGGLSGFPTTWTGAVQENVTVTGAYPAYTFQGFARACAGTLFGDCSSMSNSTTSGGWTGWIAMNGSTHTVTAAADTGAMGGSSWAWGDLVVGWIDMFSRVTVDAMPVTISGTGCQIPPGDSTCVGTATWSIPAGTSNPNVRNQTTNDQFSSGSLTGTSQPVTLENGANTLQARSNSTLLRSTTVNAGCVTGTTWDGTAGFCVSPPPTITIEAVPPVTRATRSVTIRWTINPDPLTDGTCRVNGPGISAMNNVVTSGEIESATLTAKAQYRIQCTGTYGTVERTATIDIVPEGGES